MRSIADVADASNGIIKVAIRPNVEGVGKLGQFRIGSLQSSWIIGKFSELCGLAYRPGSKASSTVKAPEQGSPLRTRTT